MVGANVLSLTDAVSQEAVVGSAQRVVVARARGSRDAAVQHCLEHLGSEHPKFELEGSARSAVQFEGALPEASPCATYAPIDPEGEDVIVVDVPSEVYELVCLVVHLARCLYAECGDGVRHPLRDYTVKPNAAHTTTITANGRSLSGMGLTQERWCCAGG